MPRVPTSIKVVSILGIIYAGFVLLLLPCAVFLQFHPLAPSPATDSLNQSPVYVVNYVIFMILSTGLSVLLLVGSIASLKLKPYGRKAMLVFAWAHIACTFVGVIVNLILIMPITERAFAADPRMASMAYMTKTIGIATSVMNVLFDAAISAVIIYFFTRKIAIDAFNGVFPAEPTNFPVDLATYPTPTEPPPPQP